MRTAKTVALWVISILLGAAFLATGVMKFYYPVASDEQFAKLGLPSWFRVLIAVLEITGAVLLVAPRLAWVGSGMLSVIMIGAVVALCRVGAYSDAPLPAVFLVLLVIITYARWPRSVSRAV